LSVEILNRACAGSEEKDDCIVAVGPNEAKAIWIKYLGKTAWMFDEHVSAICEKLLKKLGVKCAKVEINGKDALDYVILARLECAIHRATNDEGRMRIAAVRTVDAPTRFKTEKNHLRRSRLYIPGNSPRMMNSAGVYGADCLLLDLEDAVSPAEKDAARFLVKHALAFLDFGFSELFVRINPFSVCGREDVTQVLQAAPHGLTIPKVEDDDDLKDACKTMGEAESFRGLEDHSTKIMSIIETAKGVLKAKDIAKAAPKRHVVMAFGAEDYTRDIGAERSREGDELLFPRCTIVVAAKAAGIQVSDTVFADVEDCDALLAETRKIKSLGFDGKGAINPRQIGLMHEVFNPSPEEIDYALRVMDAIGEAKAKGSGVIALGSKMIDAPVAARAGRIIAIAKRTGLEIKRIEEEPKASGKKADAGGE